MLAYAADNPHPAGRAGSPRSLALIIVGHAALLAAVMAARMDVVGPIIDDIPDVFTLPRETPPPPPPQPQTDPQPQSNTQETFIDRTDTVVDMGTTSTTPTEQGPPIQDLGPVIGTGPTITIDPPRHVPVRLAARFATPGSALRPPYPLDKLRAEEEAKLTLRLSINPRGRVVGVEPVAAADPSFLEAARRHILKAWRYQPATEDGVAVPSSTVITLTFRLEDA